MCWEEIAAFYRKQASLYHLLDKSHKLISMIAEYKQKLREEIWAVLEMKNLIKTSLAFSDPNNEYDYLKRLYAAVNKQNAETTLKDIQDKGFTVREIEILTGVSKSQVSRELRE